MAAIAADVARACDARLARAAGTHALVLDGFAVPSSGIPGVGCWTSLQMGKDADWNGSLRLDPESLPFADETFCVVMVRFASREGRVARGLMKEAARVLAPHGLLLVADLHPRSLWRAGASPGGWSRGLRDAGLDVAPVLRCGAPWPRAAGARGLPRWMAATFGGAWMLAGRRSTFAAIPLRRAPASRRSIEQPALVPGARRQCA